ncbi:hypothetical protein [Azospirillum argentinense]|nr:hypothetical protein [Azospirillum argentinense]
MNVLKSKKLAALAVIVVLGIVDQFAGTDFLSAAWSSLWPTLAAP